MEAALFISDMPAAGCETVEGFVGRLRTAGISVCTSLTDRKTRIGDPVPICSVRPDVAISLGGDGTFMRAARMMAPLGVPVVGVNAGHLGFLPQYSLSEADELCTDLLKGRLNVVHKMLLALECPGMPSGIWPFAINEVAVLKEETSSMLNTRVHADSAFVADYLADGLLVSTPTGSTAYSLAAGGPIVAPDTDCLLLVPVAPHTLTLRPMAISSETLIDLEADSRTARCRVSLDGCSFTLQTPARLRIRRAPFSLKVLERPGSSFFSTLRHKLHWAQR